MMHTSHIQGVPDLGPGVRLHLNENTGGCSPAVVDAVRAFDARALATYPDYRAAVVETAAFLGVDPEWIVLTNGLDEGILLTSIAYLGGRTPAALVDAGAPMVLPNGQPEVVMALPAFEPYVTNAKALGARIVSVPPGPDYAFPVDGVIGAVTANTRLVYINNPNNPTGQPVAKDAIRRVIAAAGHALVFLDEAYHDFMGENFLEEARACPNVIVGRTFSKAHGLAGMRIGVMIAPPAILEPIRYVMPLFNLNVDRGGGAPRGAEGPEFTPWYLAQVRESKDLLYAALDRRRTSLLEERGEFRARRRRRADARAGGGPDRARRARARSLEGSALSERHPDHDRRRRAHAAGGRLRWRICAERRDRSRDGRDDDRRDHQSRRPRPLRESDRHSLSRSHARSRRAARRLRSEGRGDGRSRRRSAPHGRGCRHRARGSGRQGAGRSARHQSCRLLRHADGRDAGGGGDRSRRARAHRRGDEGHGAGRRAICRPSWCTISSTGSRAGRGRMCT